MNIRYYLALTLLSLITGCGGTPKPPPLPAEPTALKLEEWKTLPVEVKYDGATLDRLRMADPNLKDNRNWQAYERAYIIPERQKDIPTPPGQQPP